ncbi:MAG: PhzF family phenazine biosynthesis protein [Chromatocurvus sp.]
MQVALYQVDAFTDRLFAGNPAAVCPLPSWLDDTVMQQIAAENNLSETAFFVPAPESDHLGHFALRWFTPDAEVDLCGHATLASAFVIFTALDFTGDTLHFHTRSGELTVTRGKGGALCMDFPAWPASEIPDVEAARIMDTLEAALGGRAVEVRRAVNLLAVFDSEETLRSLRYSAALVPALEAADAWGLIVTAPGAPGASHDFVSRFFAPLKGVDEDPVTGSAHCTLMPYWAARLQQSRLVGYQASRRGGTVRCGISADRVSLSGECRQFLVGTATLPD